MLPCLLSVLLHEPLMNGDDGFYTDGRGVDGEAPPDYSQILDHPIGRTQRLIFNRYHASADAELHNEADRLATMLGAHSSWVERVVQAAKRVDKGSAMLKVVVGAYVEGSHSTDEVVRAAHELGMMDITGYDLFRIVNHNRSGLKVTRRYVADLYPLARIPGVVADLQALGPHVYDRFNMVYAGWIRRVELEHSGLSPKTVARMALKKAADEFGIPVDAEEAFC
ncbi:MAG: hypothetical protein JRN37_05020 [Nitrososphaerota archaeon]|nr:hypothetical protein [Nitrososphaerota archaeon]